MSTDAASLLSAYQERLGTALDRSLPSADRFPARLHEAMRYASRGGKRLRAMLVYATGDVLALEAARLDSAAVAIELIHAYSLVHDDLPAMDDDDLRRGQPTVHKAYDEATAILVGDALQTHAFQVLAQDSSGLSATQRLAMISLLARASGAAGMCGGQAIDLESVGKQLSLAEVEAMHIMKTGALIRASLLLACAAAEGEAPGLALARCAAVHPVWRQVARRIPGCVLAAFGVTGSIVEWAVPEGVEIVGIEACGAQGGDSTRNGCEGGLTVATVFDHVLPPALGVGLARCGGQLGERVGGHVARHEFVARLCGLVVGVGLLDGLLHGFVNRAGARQPVA